MSDLTKLTNSSRPKSPQLWALILAFGFGFVGIIAFLFYLIRSGDYENSTWNAMRRLSFVQTIPIAIAAFFFALWVMNDLPLSKRRLCAIAAGLIFWGCACYILLSVRGGFYWEIEQARITAATQDISSFKTVLTQFKADNDHFPVGPNGLSELMIRPEGATNWKGPYIDKDRLPTDPWGHAYIYVCPGKYNPSSTLR